MLQGLGLLVTALLARNRQPPPTVAAGVPHAELHHQSGFGQETGPAGLGWDRNSGIRNSGRNSFQEWAIPDPSQEFQVQELPRGVPWLEY